MHGKQNFVKILTKKYPEITTMVLNVNNRNTSIIVGDTESNMYGRGFIEDIIC